MSAFFLFNDPFSDKRNLFYSNCLICLRQIPGLSWYTAFLFSLDFVLKGKGAIGQLIATFEAKFSTISLKLDDIFWYYIFIVKIDPEHYIYIFLQKKSIDPSIVPHAETARLIDAIGSTLRFIALPTG